MPKPHWTDLEPVVPARPEWDPNLPVVSIITPNYNYGHYLEKCIRSVLLQTYSNIEYIIVDGGSNDTSAEVIKRYEKLGITQWISEKDNGQTDAINKGFAMTSGKIFTWLNSDDSFSHLDVIKEVVDYYQKGYQFIAGKLDMVDPSGNIVESKQAYGRSIPVTYEDYLRYWKVPSLPQPAVFVDREIANRAFPLTEDLFTIMDYEYFLRCLKENPKSIWTQTVWVDFLWHECNKTSDKIQADQNTDAEYDKVFRRESRYLSTRDQEKYLKELQCHIQLRDLTRINESGGQIQWKQLFNAPLQSPGVLFKSLYWKLLFRKLLGEKLYKQLKKV